MKETTCDASSSQTRVVKSAVRTLEILEHFDEVRQPLNVVGIAEALGYPQSSTAALLRSMTAMGYLHYNARKRTFMPTDRVPILGSWINPALFEDGALPKLARAVGKRTGQLVVLAARNADMAQYIHILSEPAAVSYHIKIGQKRPLATSAVGQVLLSTMEEKNVRRIYHRLNAYATGAEERTDVPALLSRLSAIRKSGYSFTENAVVAGYGMIAMALPRKCTSRPLALGVCGRCEALEPREAEIVGIMREEMKLYFKSAFDEAERERTVRIPAFASFGQTPRKFGQYVA